MADLDPAAVMAAHQHVSIDGENCCAARIEHGYDASWPCEPYRLAEALAAEQAKVERVEALPATWDRIVGGRESRDRADDLRAALADQPERPHNVRPS